MIENSSRTPSVSKFRSLVAEASRSSSPQLSLSNYTNYPEIYQVFCIHYPRMSKVRKEGVDGKLYGPRRICERHALEQCARVVSALGVCRWVYNNSPDIRAALKEFEIDKKYNSKLHPYWILLQNY